MNVLITGGAGFIGSHLAERCLYEQWNVSVLDDLSTGARGNIARLCAHPNFRFWLGSVFSSELVAELVDQCNLIVHFAAAVGVRFHRKSRSHEDRRFKRHLSRLWVGQTLHSTL